MSISEQQNRKYFDEHANEYDTLHKLSVEQGYKKAEYVLSNSGRAISDAVVLELGCGTGNLAPAIASMPEVREYIGLDISHGMLRVATDKSASRRNTAFIDASGDLLPFKDGSIDVVIGDAFLHHMLRPGLCLRQVYRVLKPDGFVTFNEPSLLGYAWLELFLALVKGIGDVRDDRVDDYLYFLRFMRENAGDTLALEALPLPDKHFFSFEAIQSLALNAGFKSCKIIDGSAYYSDRWREAIALILGSIGAGSEFKQTAAQVSGTLDNILNRIESRYHGLHIQFYMYR